MDRLKFRHFIGLTENMRTSFTNLRDVIDVDVRRRFKLQQNTLEAVHKEMHDLWAYKLYLVKWQKYHVDQNFVRARQAMEERTLFALALGFQETSFQIEQRIWQVSHGNLTYGTNTSTIDTTDNYRPDQDVREGLYLDALNLINAKIDLAERAHDNYTQLFGAFYNGTPIFRYKYERELRNDNVYVTPRPLLNYSIYHNSYARKYSVRVGRDIDRLKAGLVTYRELLEKSLLYGNITYEEIHKNNIYFLSKCRTFYATKATFYRETIEYPSAVLEAKIEDIERRWRNFENDYYSIYDKVLQLTTNLNYLHETILGNLETNVQEAEAYINHADDTSVNISKLEVARNLTSSKMVKGINELDNFFNDIRSRGQNVYDGWSTLIGSAGDIWAIVLHDENLREYYEYKNMTEMFRNLTDVLEELETNFTTFRDDCDFRFELGNLDSLFSMSLEQMMEAMKEYIAGSVLNKDFIRSNFLQLDIFYKEKSYEQITQQEAYDLFALMCDIGGSMGLFVGASVLTVCELLDLGLHNSIYKLTHKMR